MYRGKTVGVVVPAYNEERLIGRVIETMPSFVDRVFVVDDCSTDGTREAAERLAASSGGRVEVVRREANGGVGATIVTGYRKALDAKMDVAVVMAGDGQMDPADLPALLDPVVDGAADYTKGNRLFTGRAWEVIPHHRYLGNAFLSLLTKVASGYWHVADSQSGYTAISLEALRTIRLDRLYPRYGFPNHLLVELNIFNLRVRDVPVQPVYGVGERSGIRLWRVIPTLSWLLWRSFFRRMVEKYVIRDFHPLVFFYLFALVLLPVGFVWGIYLLVLKFFVTGRVEATSAIFAAFLIITGFQFLFFAMWFDMEYNKGLK